MLSCQFECHSRYCLLPVSYSLQPVAQARLIGLCETSPVFSPVLRDEPGQGYPMNCRNRCESRATDHRIHTSRPGRRPQERCFGQGRGLTPLRTGKSHQGRFSARRQLELERLCEYVVSPCKANASSRLRARNAGCRAPSVIGVQNIRAKLLISMGSIPRRLRRTERETKPILIPRPLAAGWFIPLFLSSAGQVITHR